MDHATAETAFPAYWVKQKLNRIVIHYRSTAVFVIVRTDVIKYLFIIYSLVLRPGYTRGRDCYFIIPFSGRHGTMTADRGARQTARGAPPARLVAPPTPPRPELGRPPSLPPTFSRVEWVSRPELSQAMLAISGPFG